MLLGYFAYLSKEKTSTVYILKRYCFFVVCALIINSLYAIKAHLSGSAIGIFSVIIESLTLDDDIFATYWCIPVFFAASVLSYLNGKANVSTLGILLEIAIFYKMQNTWISVCLMGNLVARYQLNPCYDILKSRIIRVFSWTLLFFAVKRPECPATYMIHGICCMIMIMLILRGTIVQKVLGNDLLASIGQQCMAIYILHPICYNVFAPFLFKCMSFLPYDWMFSASMIICFVLIVLISYPTMRLINTATKYTGVLISKVGTANN